MTLMQSIAIALGLTLAVTSAAPCQTVPLKPRGSYQLVADTGYAGPDLTGLVATFGDDDVLTVLAPDGSLIVKSKVSFEDGVMTLRDQDGSNSCPSVGKYKLVGDGGRFRLTFADDACTERAQIVAAISWVRQP